MSQKHPHARGEDRRDASPDGLVDRNTPTHVGKTLMQWEDSLPVRKHPHARGEDRRGTRSMGMSAETPPRTWGRLETPSKTAVSPGNTPTHVGKTLEKGLYAFLKRKHPHARGEDPQSGTAPQSLTETPPRTWGRHASLWLAGRTGRNTPTHVGKTPWAVSPDRGGSKHPHARGEDPGTAAACCWMPETPPRTWGRRHPTCAETARGRNTPTHVGKTRQGRPCST